MSAPIDEERTLRTVERLWLERRDSFDIAQRMNLPEPEVLQYIHKMIARRKEVMSDVLAVRAP